MMSTTIPASPLRVVGRNPARTVDLVVVLGMHRSGTSAITRSLRALGMELGDNLMPPHPEQNPKGFWEDMDINALNIQMLAALGKEWHSLAKTSDHDVARLREAGFMLRAAEVVRAKLKTGAPFAFKDPRISKLLPFWREVFRATRLKVAYVVAVRNPLSVVRSLGKRNDMPSEQAYYLWLDHVMPMLDSIAGEKHVFVEYDRLLAFPRLEIGRMAGTLGLDVNEDEVVAFERDFLEPELRHTEFGAGDLLLDDGCPELVLDVYNLLAGLASAEVGADEDWSDRLQGWKTQLRALEPALRFADKLSKKVEGLTVQTQARSAEVANLSQELARRVQEAEELAQHLRAEGARADEVRAQLQARSEEVRALRSELGTTLSKEEAERLQAALAARSEEASRLTSELARADAEIAEGAGRLSLLQQSRQHLDEEVARLASALSASNQESAARAADHAAAVASAQALSQQNSALDAALQAANAEAEQQRESIAVLEQTQRHLGSEVTRLNEAFRDQADEATRRSAENAALLEAQGKLHFENASLAHSLASAQVEVAERTAQVQDLAALKDRLGGDVEWLAASLAATQEQAERLAAELGASAESNGRLQAEIETLTREKAVLSGQLDEVQHRARVLNEQHADLVSRSERHAVEVAERGEALAARFAEVVASSRAVREQLKLAQEEGLAAARHNAELQRQIEEVRAEREALSSQLAAMQKQARASEQQHAELLARTEVRANQIAERGEAIAVRFAELSTASQAVRDQLTAMRDHELASAAANVDLQRQIEELRANLASREHANAGLLDELRQQRMTTREFALTLIARHDPTAVPSGGAKRLGAWLRRWVGWRTA